MWLSIPYVLSQWLLALLRAKNPAKAALVNAASTSSPSAINEFAGKYFNLYNNLLAAKNELLTADPGGEQKQALAEFGAGLMSSSF